MKLLPSPPDGLLFYLTRGEKRLFIEVLKLYPCIPPAHHKLTKEGKIPDGEACQALLDEALAEQRAENKRLLETVLSETERWTRHASGWKFSTTRGDLEWLLQILNNIRVGSWVKLGSPEDVMTAVTPENASDFWGMEIAGAFQMIFLSV